MSSSSEKKKRYVTISYVGVSNKVKFTFKLLRHPSNGLFQDNPGKLPPQR